MTTATDPAGLVKLCNGCGWWRTLDEFSKNVSSRDNLNYRCRDCTKKYRIKHYLANREKINEKRHKYYLDNKERIKERSKKQRENLNA